MKKLLAVLSVVLLLSCGGEPHVTRIDGFALGTSYSVLVKGRVPDGLSLGLDSVFVAADRSMSIFNPNSLLSRLNRNETDSVDTHIEYCLRLARGVSEMSNGKYDVTVLPLVEAYGFGGSEPDYTVNRDSILRYVGYENIEVAQGRLIKKYPQVRIDLNSIAKGYIVDLTAQYLEERSISEYLVNIGGEVFCRGTNAHDQMWVVGIETPAEGNYMEGASIQARIGVSGMGVATSGNYRNFHTDASGRKFTHIIDPTTGLNTQSNLLSATVVAPSCAMADALGTMFIALGLDASIEMILENGKMAVMLIYADDGGEMMIYLSDAMKAYMLN